jgi:mannose-6-phosphate isomerase-like protein (cupin superfamily)
MAWSRRDVCAALPGLLTLSAVVAEPLSAAAAEPVATLPGKVLIFDELKVHSEKSMSPDAPPIVLRELVRGNLRTGLAINLHESDLGPFGIPSHPPHKHRHEEMIMVIEGTLEFSLNGVISRGGPGSVMYSGPWDVHGITNPMAAHAKYYVLELGDEKSA